MLQLLLALIVLIWAGCILGGLFILFAIPCTLLTTTAVALFCLFYCWYKATLFLSGFVHGRPLEYMTAQANYTVDMTPPFPQILRTWKVAQRKGFIESAEFYTNKSMGYIGETALSTMRYITRQHKFHVALIKGAMLVLLWPFVMVAKGIILVRHWFLSMVYWLLYEVNKLILNLVSLCNYLLGTNRIAPPVEQMLYNVWAFSVGLPIIAYNSMKHAVMSIINMPYNVFRWLVSFVIPQQMMARSNGEIFLVVVGNVPLMGQNAFVQETARRVVTSFSNAVDGITSLKDHVRERYHVIMARVHWYVDGYISIPRDVVMLYAQDFLVVRPGNVIRKWMQDNLQFPDILQANNALHDIHHNPEGHSSQRSKTQCKHTHRHRHHPHCKKHRPNEESVSSDAGDVQPKQQPRTQQHLKHQQLKKRQKQQLQHLQQQWQQEYQTQPERR